MFPGNPATPASPQQPEAFREEGKGDLVQTSPFLGSGAWWGAGGQPLRPGKDRQTWRNSGPGPGLSPSPGEAPEASDTAPGRAGESEVRLANGVKGDIQPLWENGGNSLSCSPELWNEIQTHGLSPEQKAFIESPGVGWGAGAPLLPITEGALELFP